eukprot:7878350-Alexandrium_andersonii.AAC.1
MWATNRGGLRPWNNTLCVSLRMCRAVGNPEKPGNGRERWEQRNGWGRWGTTGNCRNRVETIGK